MMDRICCFWLCLVVCAAPGAFCEERVGHDTTTVPPKVRRAVAKGLAYLAGQIKSNGSFGRPKVRVAVTSFACLAFMAGGNLPGRGRYGRQVERGLNFILQSVSPSGYITRSGDASRMHGQGFATLCLAQAYGMTRSQTQSQRIRAKLEQAIRLILRSQTHDGGWGYYYDSEVHEGSVTVVQLQALRACRNAGLKVSKKSIDRAVEYVRRSANPNGSFKYRLGFASTRYSFPLSAAGVSSLNATGEYDSPEIRRGLDFMMKYLPPRGLRDRYYTAFYFYGQFYAAQAMYHAPLRFWNKWYPAICKELLRRQNVVTGAWRHSRYGNSYATAIATLVLQIPYRYLPIFQR